MTKQQTKLYEKKQLYIKQNGKCNICQKKFVISDQADLDHIVPKFRGGSNAQDNLQLLCKTCHIQKSIKEKKYVTIRIFLKDFERLVLQKIHSAQPLCEIISKMLDKENKDGNAGTIKQADS